jgi:hypothetical protein
MTSHKTLTSIAVLTALVLVPAATADMLVWLNPATPEVEVGQPVTVDLMASFDEPVMGWGLDLTIDEPTYASWSGTTLGGAWDPTTTIDGDGLAGLRFPDGISGETLLATLTFEGLAEGVTALTLGSGPEEDEGILLASGELATNVQFTGATLTVVPEPAAVLLLAGLIVLPRRR